MFCVRNKLKCNTDSTEFSFWVNNYFKNTDIYSKVHCIVVSQCKSLFFNNDNNNNIGRVQFIIHTYHTAYLCSGCLGER